MDKFIPGSTVLVGTREARLVRVVLSDRLYLVRYNDGISAVVPHSSIVRCIAA